MSLKRIMWWILFAFIAYFVVRAPRESGELVREAGLVAQDAFAWVGDRLIDFAQSRQ